MKVLKRFVALTACCAMLGSAAPALAQESCEEGVAYYEGYRCSYLTPAIGLGVIAIAAIIAVAINNANQGHAHQHAN